MCHSLAGPAGDLFKAIAVASVVLIAAAGLAAIVSLAFRYRRAGTMERAQLKWLVYAAAVIVVAVFAQIPIASTNLQNAISIGAVALVPAGGRAQGGAGAGRWPRAAAGRAG